MAKAARGRWLKATVFVNGAVPLAMLVWDGAHDRLGVNPVDFITRTTGTLTLVFLIATLAVSTLRRLGVPAVIMKVRRMLGLYAFFYGLLHFMTYLWLDRFFHLQDVVGDLVGRPFITVGFAAFLLMVPMAVTSTDGMIRRLGGKRWRKIHRRMYWVVVLGLVHYLMLVKVVTAKQIWFGMVIAVLRGERLLVALREKGAPKAAAE
jgi:sulfoxide reductase heme-binding subunit YedZ